MARFDAVSKATKEKIALWRGKGWTQEEVAEKLGLSKSTVRRHQPTTRARRVLYRGPNVTDQKFKAMSDKAENGAKLNGHAFLAALESEKEKLVAEREAIEGRVQKIDVLLAEYD